MLTQQQATKICLLAEDYASAAADAEMAGAQPPEEAQWLRDQKQRAREAFRSYVNLCKEKK